jgi:hypothetical protein
MNDKFIYEDGDKDDCFFIHKDIQYQLSNKKIIIIPKGMETDFATIPRFFWRLFPPHLKKYRRGAIVHDYLYMTEDVVTSRAFADAEFRRILINQSTPKWQAWLFWLVIRLFGNKRWNKYKQNAS